MKSNVKLITISQCPPGNPVKFNFRLRLWNFIHQPLERCNRIHPRNGKTDNFIIKYFKLKGVVNFEFSVGI